MRINLRKYLPQSALALSVLVLSAAGPMKNDIVELKAFVNGRTEAKFRDGDDNKTVQLRPGLRAIVQEVKRFETGNYGLCLKVLTNDPAKDKDCYWVHHVPSRPTVEFFSYTKNIHLDDKHRAIKNWRNEFTEDKIIDLKAPKKESAAKPTAAAPPASKPTRKSTQGSSDSFPDDLVLKPQKEPSTGSPARVTQTTEAVVAPAPTASQAASAPAAAAPASSGASGGSDGAAAQAGHERLMKETVDQVDRTNQGLGQAMAAPAAPQVPCKRCSEAGLRKEEICKPGNDYLENEIDSLANEPESIVSQILAKNQPSKYIKENCFLGAIQSSGGPFKRCYSDGKQINRGKKVQRACLSPNLKKIVQRSFDLTIDCLGEYIAETNAGIPATAENFFFLIAHESGHGVNAQSGRGAGGSTQMTEGAIQTVNAKERAVMRKYVAEKMKTSPHCKAVEQVLESGMSVKNSCDKISLKSGNPLLNLVYGLGYQKFAKESAKNYVIDNRLNAKVFKSLEPGAREYLLNNVSQWAHNTGEHGMKRALMNMVERHIIENRKPLVTMNDVEKWLADLRRSVGRTTGKERSPIEPMNFWGTIQDGKKRIERNSGDGSCLIKN